MRFLKQRLFAAVCFSLLAAGAQAQTVLYDSTIDRQSRKPLQNFFSRGFDADNNPATGDSDGNPGNGIDGRESLVTSLVADDINLVPEANGYQITSIGVQIANLNTVSINNFNVRFRVWAIDGGGGAGPNLPGTIIYSDSANVASLGAAGTLSSESFVSITIPNDALFIKGRTFWAGISFDNNNNLAFDGNGSALNLTQMDLLAMPLYNPTVGFSQDQGFGTNNGALNDAVSNPAGQFGGGIFTVDNAVTNFGFRFTGFAVPEPSALPLVLVAGLPFGVVALRRAKRR